MKAVATAERGFIEAVRAQLRAAADPSRAPAMQAYMKSAMPYLGVGSQQWRGIVKQTSRAGPLPDVATLAATMLALWREATHREERYVAMELALFAPHRKLAGLELLPVYEEMISSGAWWDYVDDIACFGIGALLPEHASRIHPRLRRWAVGEDLWLRRAAIICQRRLKPEQFDAHLLYGCILPAIGQRTPLAREFFLRKAVGWALRERARQAPEEVAEFCRQYHDQLSPLSLREAMRGLARSRGLPLRQQ